MTVLGELLRDGMRGGGPMRFDRFMEAALYHPELGYYRRGRRPFGSRGDFFTASQLQPVFGMLMAASVRNLYPGEVPPVLELGSGSGEMAEAFAPFGYAAVDIGHGAIPDGFRGTIFANEFFDALPVRAGAIRGARPMELHVSCKHDSFVWHQADTFEADALAYIARYYPALEEGRQFEFGERALETLERIGESLQFGHCVAIDYGYLAKREGTLMSYRGHVARPDVLCDPGEQDITAHVNFQALMDGCAGAGLQRTTFERFQHTILSVLPGVPEAMATAERRAQVKTLLVSFGETFQTLIMQKAPVSRGPQ